MIKLDSERIEQALQLLGERLTLAEVGPYSLVVCGGAALISCGLVSRMTTHDVHSGHDEHGSGLGVSRSFA